MYTSTLVLFVLIFFCSVHCRHYLSEVLNYHELLHIDDVSHKIVRRDLSSAGHERTIHFKFDGKSYSINLQQKIDILREDFVAVSIDRYGQEHPIALSRLEYYKGTVEEDENAYVLAHVQNGMINAEIIFENESIYIEPAEPHLRENSSSHMLVYKLSDLKWNLTAANSSTKMHQKNCILPELNNKHPVNNEIDMLARKPKETNARKRRAVATSKNVCGLTLVADYTYFQNIGNGDQMTTINYMIQVVSRVHEIYRRTDFDGIGTNIGFKIQKVIVHDSFSTEYEHKYLNEENSYYYFYTKSEAKHFQIKSAIIICIKYNKAINGVWNVDQLLTVFSRTDWSKTCLSHLFTYQDFSNGIIGLAYVASASQYEVGGICTKDYQDIGGFRFLNCGLSSSINWGRRLLTAEADLVTAHEIGHNFGSNHDPPNCQSGVDNGNYIMYAHSVSGDKVNNNLFSSCSRFSMGRVLQSKRHLCFTEQKENSFCGNLIVEDGEECDSGLLNPSDQCCNSQCKFKLNPSSGQKYICSDIHDPCCQNCRIAPATKTCRNSTTFYCAGKTFCSGNSKKCPDSPRLNGNESCGFSKGNCIGGKCISMCAQKGKISCYCSAGDNSCKICCKDSKDAKCVVLAGGFNEGNGIVCGLLAEKGQCVNGICQKNQRNVKDEFSDLLKDFSFGKFVRFMQANIVGTILTLSLLIWIPASCAVSYIDKRNLEEVAFMIDWNNPKNKDLLPNSLSVQGKLKNFFRGSKRQKRVRTQYHISS